MLSSIVGTYQLVSYRNQIILKVDQDVDIVSTTNPEWVISLRPDEYPIITVDGLNSGEQLVIKPTGSKVIVTMIKSSSEVNTLDELENDNTWVSFGNYDIGIVTHNGSRTVQLLHRGEIIADINHTSITQWDPLPCVWDNHGVTYSINDRVSNPSFRIEGRTLNSFDYEFEQSTHERDDVTICKIDITL
jgi:hypothetical protein